eukprot:CAMPEP_0182570592 /NCGR_PEP_ID=MMETSP1324-20130603/10860_1 /TAXON_ID=236786 /ORGANISM="Florenciella sp., Strain RCC1587" /LENGTH=131 /DNA_ID=CAMNT_0024785005 /DNA_START=56 /DNA_END=449 /DNA_ORIENTATION=+
MTARAMAAPIRFTDAARKPVEEGLRLLTLRRQPRLGLSRLPVRVLDRLFRCELVYAQPKFLPPCVVALERAQGLARHLEVAGLVVPAAWARATLLSRVRARVDGSGLLPLSLFAFAFGATLGARTGAGAGD